MLNSGWNSNYKNLAKKTEERECRHDDKPVSEVVVDFRSRLFRYVRLVYTNRNHYDRARSVFRTMVDLRLSGKVITERKNVFHAALRNIKKDVFMMQVEKSTYVFSSANSCPHKEKIQAKHAEKRVTRLEELEKCIALYRKNMFDMKALEQCAFALESYIISDIDSISTMYSGKEWLLGVGAYKVPSSIDSFESDRMVSRLAKISGAAVLSEDFDCIALFGTDLMVKEVHKNFFVYVSLKDVMANFESYNRKDMVHKCCIMGTDYNLGLKGVGPVKVKKIDATKAKKLFETCLTAQSMKPAEIYKFLLHE